MMYGSIALNSCEEQYPLLWMQVYSRLQELIPFDASIQVIRCISTESVLKCWFAFQEVGNRCFQVKRRF